MRPKENSEVLLSAGLSISRLLRSIHCLRGIRNDSRYAELLKKMNLPSYPMLEGRGARSFIDLSWLSAEEEVTRRANSIANCRAAVHSMWVSSMGEVHDHKGQWTSERENRLGLFREAVHGP